MKIYVGQSKLSIELVTNLNLSDGYTSVEIDYIAPDTVTTGIWSSTVSNPINGTILYVLPSPSPLNQRGYWTLWAKITFLDGTIAIGAPTKIFVYNPGE